MRPSWEGRKEVGHQYTEGLEREKPLRTCRVPERGAGSALDSGVVEGGGSPGVQIQRSGLTWPAFGGSTLRPAAGRSSGARGPHRSPAQRAQGGCTPHSGLLPPGAKGPVVPRDSGREPEPLCLHSPGTPAGECLGPSAPPGCEARPEPARRPSGAIPPTPLEGVRPRAGAAQPGASQDWERTGASFSPRPPSSHFHLHVLWLLCRSVVSGL